MFGPPYVRQTITSGATVDLSAHLAHAGYPCYRDIFTTTNIAGANGGTGISGSIGLDTGTTLRGIWIRLTMSHTLDGGAGGSGATGAGGAGGIGKTFGGTPWPGSPGNPGGPAGNGGNGGDALRVRVPIRLNNLSAIVRGNLGGAGVGGGGGGGGGGAGCAVSGKICSPSSSGGRGGDGNTDAGRVTNGGTGGAPGNSGSAGGAGPGDGCCGGDAVGASGGGPGANGSAGVVGNAINGVSLVTFEASGTITGAQVG